MAACTVVKPFLWPPKAAFGTAKAGIALNKAAFTVVGPIYGVPKAVFANPKAAFATPKATFGTPKESFGGDTTVGFTGTDLLYFRAMCCYSYCTAISYK